MNDPHHQHLGEHLEDPALRALARSQGIVK